VKIKAPTINDMLQAKTIEKPTQTSIAAEPKQAYMTADMLKKSIEKLKKQMNAAAKDMDFDTAARLRDEMFELQKLLGK
jgi:excinuclease ABC subunit B